MARLAMMVTGAFAVLLAAAQLPARADGDRHRQEGVTIRLVALPPAPDGRIRGALSVDLEPGWKTYWIAPGPAGLAPQLDFSGSRGVSTPKVAYPVPVRFAEGEAQSLGYVEPVAFPIEARAEPGAVPTLRVAAFLGVCRELCVPVQAVLTAAPSASLSDRALVMRAEEALPSEEGPLGVSAARWSANALVFPKPAGTSGPVDAFVSAGDGWSFGAPMEAAAGADIAVPVLTRPARGAVPPAAVILLTTAARAQLSRAVPIAPR